MRVIVHKVRCIFCGIYLGYPVSTGYSTNEREELDFYFNASSMIARMVPVRRIKYVSESEY